MIDFKLEALQGDELTLHNLFFLWEDSRKPPRQTQEYPILANGLANRPFFGLVCLGGFHFVGCRKWGCNKKGLKSCLAALPGNQSAHIGLFRLFSPFSGEAEKNLGNPENGGAIMRLSALTVQHLLCLKKKRRNPTNKGKGFSLCGNPKILGKKGQTHQQSKENRKKKKQKSKDIEKKKKKTSFGGSGWFGLPGRAPGLS